MQNILNIDLQTLLDDVEAELLSRIIVESEQKQLTRDKAAQLARDFLDLLPPQDKVDLLHKLGQLGEKYPEFRRMYIKYASEYEEELRQKKLQLMSEHIKQGEIEKALQVAKGGGL